jgi:hypothetical protein
MPTAQDLLVHALVKTSPGGINYLRPLRECASSLFAIAHLRPRSLQDSNIAGVTETRTCLGVSDRDALQHVPMQQSNAPRARALIIEDEILIALELEELLAWLRICDLRPSSEWEQGS